MPELSILICTFQRPVWLEGLLRALDDQTGPRPSHEIVVVDNDPGRTAAPLEALFPAVRWLQEPRAGVSHARNRAVEAATAGAWLFMDDDQLLARDALSRLWAEWATRPGGITGLRLPVRRVPDSGDPLRDALSVEPLHAAPGPAWAPVGRHEFGTGGLLVDAALFSRPEMRFDPTYGLSGGEDTDLFVRASAMGAVFAWSRSTEVLERTPDLRATLRYRALRQFNAGRIDGDINRRHGVVLKKLPFDKRVRRWANGEAATALKARLSGWWTSKDRWDRLMEFISYRAGRLAERAVTCLRLSPAKRTATPPSARWR